MSSTTDHADSRLLRIVRQADVGCGRVAMEPIRHLESMSSYIRYALANAFRTYRAVLGTYRHAQLEDFNSRYRRRVETLLYEHS